MTHQTLSLEKYWKLFPATLNKWQQAVCLIYMYGKVRSELIDNNGKEMKTQNVQISWHFICLQLYVAIYWLSWFKNDILKKQQTL